jgi:hypothetical protein
MKVPRIEDFDPNAAHKLGTPMDDLPRIERPPVVVEVPMAEPAPLPVATAPKTNREGMPPASNRDTTIPRHHDTTLSIVRKAVKEFGKEAATHRFTQDEKKAIAELIYTFRQRDIRTSENEITRIAVNFVIEDLKRNGAGTVLDQVLKLLNQ